jgi:mono/diheme cytochrome c family protein
MRRFLRNHPEYLMAVFVVLLVVVLALARSAGFAITLGPETPAAESATDADEHPWFDLGTEVWDTRCYSCHAALTHLPELFLAEGGRTYLLELMLFGVRGQVVIEGVPVNLRHRPYASLDDEQLAAVLNLMLVAWGNDEAMPAEVSFYTTEETAGARPRERSNEEVLEGRPNPWR